MVNKVQKVKEKYVVAVGRRKEAVARVRLYKGKGEGQVNGKGVEKYFPGARMKVVYMRPFEVTGTLEKYFATVKVVGGGKRAQLGAMVLGVARALVKVDEEKYRRKLKQAGLLTRDARAKERRKYGLAQKARAKKQSPKR